MEMDLGKKYDDDIWNLPIPVFCIDIVIFTYYKGKLCVMDKKNLDGKIKYIIPGGIMKSGYTLEDNFNSILKKETGIDNIFKQQIHVFGDPGHDKRGHSVSLSFLSLIPEEELLKSIDFTKSNLIEYDDLNNIDIGYSFEHKKIIEHAKYHLIKRMEFSSIAKHMIKEKFTFNFLHELYEEVYSEKIDIRNFKKKLLYMKLISEVGETDKSNSKKPAKVYRFN